MRILALVTLFVSLTCIVAQTLQSPGASSPVPGKLTEPIKICDPEHSSSQESCLFPCNYRRRPANEPCVVPPKPMSLPFPEYSDKARKQRIEGKVELQITVDSNGKVSDAKITRSLEPSLDNKSLEAVRKWRFEPATLEARRVAVTLDTETSFHLRN